MGLQEDAAPGPQPAREPGISPEIPGLCRTQRLPKRPPESQIPRHSGEWSGTLSEALPALLEGNASAFGIIQNLRGPSESGSAGTEMVSGSGRESVSETDRIAS